VSEDCPICGENKPHEHIISNALPPGDHSTYEELLTEVERYENTPPTWAELSNLQDENEELKIAKKPDFAAWCAEEREGGAGGCGACVICCKELQTQRDDAWLALGAILDCATSGGPQDMMVDLGMIRIECRRALGQPGATEVPTLRSMIDEDSNR
jgi:hypothetical protein